MEDLLKKRHPHLNPPIQMCDALSRNLPKKLKTILANCLTHGRRKFVDLVSNFPQECEYVIDVLAKVYHNDKIAKCLAVAATDASGAGASFTNYGSWVDVAAPGVDILSISLTDRSGSV